MCSRRVGDVFEGGAGGGEKACALRRELGDLERAERSLDELIHSSTTQLKQLTEHKDNQRYPSHASLCLTTFPPQLFCCLVTHANIYLISVAVVFLDTALHAGLCDVPRHPLHQQSPRPDSHCRQGPCRDQAGGARYNRGERTSRFELYSVFLMSPTSNLFQFLG